MPDPEPKSACCSVRANPEPASGDRVGESSNVASPTPRARSKDDSPAPADI
jgi:hypothetical protein